MLKSASPKKRFQGKVVHVEPRETFISTHITGKNEHIQTLQPKASSSTAGYLDSLSSNRRVETEPEDVDGGGGAGDGGDNDEEVVWPALDDAEPEPVCQLIYPCHSVSNCPSFPSAILITPWLNRMSEISKRSGAP
jgi:hypothetical protein